MPSRVFCLATILIILGHTGALAANAGGNFAPGLLRKKVVTFYSARTSTGHLREESARSACAISCSFSTKTLFRSRSRGYLHPHPHRGRPAAHLAARPPGLLPVVATQVEHRLETAHANRAGAQFILGGVKPRRTI